MAKVYPQTPITSATIDSTNMTSTKETFTIWMKSLVFHGNGFTVFNSNGEIVYRIDNYNKKCSGEVYLMDLRGKVLFSIHRKKLQVFGGWDGYKWKGSGSEVKKEVPWFEARRKCCMNILKRNIVSCDVSLGCDHRAKTRCYEILGLGGKSSFKIVDRQGALVAEVKQKEASSGILLGNDVLKLVVEPQVDHSLIMALVTVYGLINRML
ncbi:hypothetical protein LguiB_028834 [Lonicera macranthoides]